MKKVLIVCGNGLGSSFIVEMNVKKILAEMNKEAEVAHTDLTSAKSETADLFCGATAGVYGNITGGRRGAVVGAFAHGLLISFLPAILLPMMGDMGLGSTTFGDADFGVVGIVLGHIIAMFN